MLSVRSLVRKAHALHTKPRTAHNVDHLRERKHNLIHIIIIIEQYDDLSAARLLIYRRRWKGVLETGIQCSNLHRSLVLREKIHTSTAEKSSYNLSLSSQRADIKFLSIEIVNNTPIMDVHFNASVLS